MRYVNASQTKLMVFSSKLLIIHTKMHYLKDTQTVILSLAVGGDVDFYNQWALHLQQTTANIKPLQLFTICRVCD